MKLSIVLPAIRVDRWDALYNSIQVDFPFELIIVSPYALTPYLQSRDNVKYIRDWGSPMRASCLGANIAEGKYLTWAADDGVFFSETIKKAVNILDNDINGRLVVVTKYLEACSEVHPDWYYQLTIAYPKSPYIPDSWKIFNCAFLHTEYYQYLGGWDCIFEACPLGHADLAARAQRDGCTTTLIQDPLLDCTHMPGASGDHGPVYFAHIQNDDPLYSRIYNSPDCVHRVQIDINNWRKAPRRWSRRF
jgi:hypothetical protein